MKTDLITAAQLRVDQAQQELDSALERGTDTTPAREFLQAAEAELARLLDAKNTAANQAQGDADADLNRRADELAAEAKRELIAEFTRLGFKEIPAFNVPVGPAISLVKITDQAAAEAEEEQARQSKCDALRRRIEVLDGRIGDMIHRRYSGDELPTDAANHQLWISDRDGLRRLLALASDPPDKTRTAEWVDEARTAWLRTIGGVRAGALNQMAISAEELLCDLALEMSRPAYGVSPRRWRPFTRLQSAIAGICR
jgi:transposase-like protein